jgi:hypothetical protein
VGESKDLPKQEQAAANPNARLRDGHGRVEVIDETENNKADDEQEDAGPPAA